MSILSTAGRRLAAMTAAAAVILSAVVIAQPALADSAPVDPTDPKTPVTVTADPLPTTQIDGVAWSQVVVGNTVYVAGKFQNARPAGAAAGTNLTPRSNLLAYDIRTGALITSFAPKLNAQALSVTASPDGSRIYVVGDFTDIDGQGYYRAAAFSTATGKIIPAFRPIMGSQTRTVSASNDTVYLGGTFRSVNGAARNYLAAVSATDGSTKPFVADADTVVDALTLTKDASKLVVGGRFTQLSGTPTYGLGAVDPSSGAALPWAANQKVQNAGKESSITSLFATDDRVYGSGYTFGAGGNLEGAFSADPNTGVVNWVEDCHGDTYSVFATSTVAYVAGHPHYCGNIGGFPQTDPWTFQHSIAFSKQATGTATADPYGYHNWAGTPSPSLLNWFPKYVTGSFTGQGQAAWSVNGNEDYIVVGGEFPYVNTTAQQGLVRYATAKDAPNKIGPNSNDQLVPKAISYTKGEARVSWQATFDRDNTRLTYKIVRDGKTATPVYTVTQDSTFWQRPSMGFIDKGLVPGSTHTYRVYVTDAAGNSVNRVSDTVTITDQSGGDAYATSVKDDGATAYYPLDEKAGTAGLDHVAFEDLRVDNATRGAAGPIDGSTATTFSGQDGSFAVTPQPAQSPNTFSVESWVKTTSTSGGKVVGYGNNSTGTSGNYDRMVYLDNDGRIFFGVYTGATQTLNSAPGFNDGKWHQIVATMSSAGMKLFVDGKLVGQRADTTAGQDYVGYWRVGGDNLGGWPNQPASYYLAGDIAQVSIYPTALTRADVVDHLVASGRTSPIPPAPSDAYGKAVYAADPSSYWRLDDADGSSTLKDAGQNDVGANVGRNVRFGQAGALSGSVGQAAAFSDSIAVSQQRVSNPTSYSLEMWFQTTTTRGGKLIGFGDNADPFNFSGSYDRHVYMQDDGRLQFGTWTGQTNLASSPRAYNDGQWHHMVASQGSDGLKLYVDGDLVGQNGQTQAQAYDGYWRIGGDNTWGSSSGTFEGRMDEVAVYPTVLAASTIATHYSLGTTGRVPNQAPKAAFTQTADFLTASFDATGSTDTDGTVTGYAWDFGDGVQASGATQSHTYAAAGTYPVVLTVTDDRGTTNRTQQDVTVKAAPANIAPTAVVTATTTDLTAKLDGSASTDADGTVASYAWDFGDGGTGTGPTPTHAYAAGGTYTVTLTVTDDKGLTGTASTQVQVTAPPVNREPTAVIASTTTDLVANLDGRASSDPDGTIASWAWEFGDGTTGTGASIAHPYAKAGTYTVALTVTDDKGATGRTTASVTVTAPPVNQAPVAAFTSTVANLVASLDASTSSDPDGTVASYAWAFGDGTTGTGRTTTHAYAAAGTFAVSLTVTDDKGLATTTTSQVTVQAPASNVLAQDSFGRTTTNGWGQADVGGAWTVTSGSASILSVGDGVGRVASGIGSTRTMTLGGVTSTTSDATLTFALDKVPTGGGDYTRVISRQVGSSSYQAQVWVRSTGQVTLLLTENGTALTTVVVPGVAYTAGQKLQVRVQTAGTSPTTLRAKVWPAGQTEPSAWTATSSGTAPALQAAGSFGIQTFLSSSATAPVTTTVDDVRVSSGEAATTPTPTNQAPTAAFTSTAKDLTASFDGSPSTDADGTVASYAWAFGDGTTGTGKTVDHAYAAAGTYAVSLTVTDDKGLVSAKKDGTVTVTAPVVTPANQAPTAAFTSTAKDLTASFDASTSTDADGTVASYAWAFGDGTTGTGRTTTHVYAAAGTYTVSLTVTDDKGLASAKRDGTVTVTAPVVTPVPAAGVLAKDAFERTAANGWGTAETGGAWTVTSGSASIVSVKDGAGQVASGIGSTRTLTLGDVSTVDSDIAFAFSLDKLPTGGGDYTRVISRQVGSASYQTQVWVRSTGQVTILQSENGTALRTTVVPGLTYTAGQQLQVRVRTTGTSPTTLEAKVWPAGQPEPTAWTATATGTAAALQAAGGIGIQTYLSGTAAAAVTTRIDDLLVTDAKAR
ncbi:PKD domain-containing protein [Clavibacter michiganensis subsp. phaseoli]|uniref:PKD domain-containing protein n=1 Tax=Clavibacter phaseoli TaxID=1734031 RepID=A0A8I0S7M3_9MICO|nr:PKD domain-containing protein [Clavibacter phaseoli]MBF4630518.1 PKD domain-containing protein [Clavibacter phaseoli]